MKVYATSRSGGILHFLALFYTADCGVRTVSAMLLGSTAA